MKRMDIQEMSVDQNCGKQGLMLTFVCCISESAFKG
jgi:hypothetical protein